MEKVPACGSLLASLDPTAYVYAREGVGPNGPSVLPGSMAIHMLGGSGSGVGSGVNTSSTPTSTGSLDIRVVIDGVLKGKIKVVGFDVASSRHLVVRVQALLFCVPTANRDVHWAERKRRCDSLLSLCSSLSESEVKSHLKGTGLKLE